jgi:hypothetical protein
VRLLIGDPDQLRHLLLGQPVPVHRNETRLCTYAAIGMAAICLART